MKTVAFVPIKLNNQRLPNKNILPLGNEPLCSYIFKTLLNVKSKGFIDEIYVFCSDEKIKDFISTDIKFLQRDTALDGDLTIGIDIYQSFCNKIDADVYVLCHATSPFTTTDSLIKGIISINNGYDSAFSCEKIQTFCWYKDRTLNYNFEHVPRTQDIEPIYIETSGFYIFTKDVINNNRRIGHNSNKIIVNKKEAVDIDYKEDYDLAVFFNNS